MMTSERFVAYCRTPRGQLSLIAVTFVGAVITAGMVLGLRLRFAGTVYERFPTERQQPMAGELRELAADIAAGRKARERVDDLSASELIVVYGVLIDDESLELRGPLAAALWERQGEEMLVRIRRTLVAGNRRQRLRALEFLGTMPAVEFVGEAAHLCRYALERATRCRDDEVAAKARSVLADIEQT